VDLHNDGLGLRLADPDWQQPRPALLLKDEHVRLSRTIESESGNDDFNHGEKGLRVLIFAANYRADPRVRTPAPQQWMVEVESSQWTVDR
jgi:hypothetical protein